MFIDYYLSNGVLGSSLSNGGRSLRSVVGTLSKEAFERVKCTGTSIILTNSRPVNANLDAASSFNFLVTPAIKIADKKLIGKVIVKSSTSASLCSAEIAPDGTGSCLVTFTGTARTENITLAFEGRRGYIDSTAAAAITLTNNVPFRFEVAQIIPGRSDAPQCEPFSVRANDPEESYTGERCGNPKLPLIRCVETGCALGRFYAFTIKRVLSH